MKSKHVKIFLFTAALIVCAAFGAGAAGFDLPATGDALGYLVAAVPLVAIPALECYDPSRIRISQAEFEALKAKHKHIYVLDIVLSKSEKYQFIIKRPSRDVVTAVGESSDNLGHINKLIINDMVLAGDKDALDDGLVYNALMKQLSNLIHSAQAFLAEA